MCSQLPAGTRCYEARFLLARCTVCRCPMCVTQTPHGRHLTRIFALRWSMPAKTPVWSSVARPPLPVQSWLSLKYCCQAAGGSRLFRLSLLSTCTVHVIFEGPRPVQPPPANPKPRCILHPLPGCARSLLGLNRVSIGFSRF